MTNEAYKIGPWTFDPVSAVLRKDDTVKRLPGLSVRVLSALAAHAPNPVDAACLARDAWNLDHVEEDTIAQRITLLRKAMGDDPRAPVFIRTERGRGYALIAPVHRVRASSRPWKRIVISAGATALALALIYAGTSSPHVQQPSVSEIDALLARAGDQLVLHQREETERAIALLRAARERAPQDARTAVLLSLALSTEATKFEGGHAEEAETLSRQALAADEAAPQAWHALGYALDAQGRHDEALTAYLRAVRLDPSSRAGPSAAYLLSQQGRLVEALRLDLQSLELGAGSIYAELQLAHALRLLGDERRAQAFEARALLLNPDHPVVLGGLASAALARGEPEVALELISRVSPADRQLGRLLKLEGRARLMTGDAAEAEALFEAAGPLAAHERSALTGRPPPVLKPGELWPGAWTARAESPLRNARSRRDSRP